MIRRRILIIALLCILGLASTLVWAEEIPDRLTDQAFWRLVTEFSEPGGEFPSENFVSNELTFQSVIPRLRESNKPGGVYLGVGPEQNFTYIAALQPKIAFIVDIRRQNMIQHLMYKALIEMSADRADFLSRLFSRKRPEGLGPASSANQLFAAYTGRPQDPALFDKALADIKKHLTETHGFPLTFLDENVINFILSAFFFGPGLTYDGPGNRPNMANNRPPTFAELMVQTDSAAVARSYLASEENFQILQDLERRNMIVPVVGNFAGEDAIRRIGGYLKAHDATVTAFYLSNVEQYLFQQEDDWRKFYGNVETLPLNSASTFIRSVFNQPVNRSRSISLLGPIQNLLAAVRSGAVTTYADVIALSQ